MRPFTKGYLPGWKGEAFVVKRAISRRVPTYKIEEFDGTPFQGTFYGEEPQKVSLDDASLFRVEKVLRRRGNRSYVR